jgi:hypothetical protein
MERRLLYQPALSSLTKEQLAISIQHSAKELNRNGREVPQTKKWVASQSIKSAIATLETEIYRKLFISNSSFASFALFAVNRFC